MCRNQAYSGGGSQIRLMVATSLPASWRKSCLADRVISPVGGGRHLNRAVKPSRAEHHKLQGDYFAPSFLSQRANVLFSGSWQMTN
jgi:hypothetical protein